MVHYIMAAISGSFAIVVTVGALYLLRIEWQERQKEKGR
jgi:hypothetical protein